MDHAISTESNPREPVPITVGGLPYVPVDAQAMTFDHDVYMSEHCHAAGLGELGGLLDSWRTLPDRDLEQLCGTILARLTASGRLRKVLAGTFVPAGREWTRELAAETESALARVSDPGEKRALWASTASVVLGFFQHAAQSRGISLSSLVSGSRGERAATAGPATSATSPG